MKLIQIAKIVALTFGFAGWASASYPEQLDGHFSTWEDVPAVIDSITENSYGKQLKQLHDLTRIKLGFPQSSLCLNDDDHQHYMLHTKQRWQHWWETTGKSVSELKRKNSKVDYAAFQMAFGFLGTKQSQPKDITPVWIPTSWTLYVAFTNGDYGGLEKELWIIDRQTSGAKLTKLRGDYGQGWGTWRVTLSELRKFTPEDADQVLKAICYVHLYTEAGEDNPNSVFQAKDGMEGLYYPHSTLRLRDGSNRILWNSEGYTFSKSRSMLGDGASGRSYYFLRSVFSDERRWKVVLNPTSELLAPYRKFLSLSKPYFSSNSHDIIELFSEHGGRLEIQAMFEWAEKQKVATDPEMGWEPLSDDFGTGAKENVLSITRSSLKKNLQRISKAMKRLEADQKAGQAIDDELYKYREQEIELNRYVTDMQAVKTKDKRKKNLRRE